MPLSLVEYQREAHTTAQYPNDDQIKALTYLFIKLGGECGEAQNKFGKMLRGDIPFTLEFSRGLVDELGDALWYLSEIAYVLGYSLEFVARKNLAKLADRAQRGQIKGSGDQR